MPEGNKHVWNDLSKKKLEKIFLKIGLDKKNLRYKNIDNGEQYISYGDRQI